MRIEIKGIRKMIFWFGKGNGKRRFFYHYVISSITRKTHMLIIMYIIIHLSKKSKQ